MIKLRRTTRLIAAVGTVAIGAVALVTTTASALPPNTAPNGVMTISPTTGTRTTAITVSFPGGAACSADSATGGIFESTYITNAADPSQLTFPSGNPTGNASDFVQPMFSAGNPQTNITTATGTGAVLPPSAVDLATFPPNFVPAGNYKVGLACYVGTTGAIDKYWQTSIAIAVNGSGVITGYSLLAVPGAPTLASPLTTGNGTLSGSFTAPAASPAATGYTVTAQPQPSGTAVTLPVAAPGAFTLTGLNNGTTYSVTVTQTNAAGTSGASNAVLGTPSDPNAQPAVTGLQAVPGAGVVTLNWTPPAGSQTPTGYTIGVSPTVAGQPFSIAPASTYTVSGLTAGTLYTFTVTATYNSPFTGTPATATATPTGSAVITQEIDVTRPVGGLVLTQVCGRYGALLDEPASPGFGLLPAVTASGTGSAPTIDSPAGADPLFPQYPYPVNAAGDFVANYPTHCGLHLATPTLITSGTEAGKYFKTDGRLNQVTIVDTRDGDAGWNISGSMTNFDIGGVHGASCDSTATCFSGNYLGWTPKVTDDSDVTLEGYDQAALPGGTVLPAFSSGLKTSPQQLGHAVAGSGLGIAVFDARLKLLIPVTANTGTYQATLTLSAT